MRENHAPRTVFLSRTITAIASASHVFWPNVTGCLLAQPVAKLDSPKVLVSVIRMQWIASVAFVRHCRDAQNARIGQSFCNMLMSFRYVEHLIFLERNCAVLQVDATSSLQHDQHALRFMSMRLRLGSLVHFEAHHANRPGPGWSLSGWRCAGLRLYFLVRHLTLSFINSWPDSLRLAP